MQKSVYRDEYYTLWLHLILVKDMIHRARKEELGRIGITVSEASVLFYSKALGDRATPTEISRCIFRRPHGISALVSRMERKGLVKKIKDLRKKNLVRVELTAKGQQAQKDASKRVVIRRIISSLSKDERQQLSSYLEKLRSKAFGELRLDEKVTYLGYER